MYSDLVVVSCLDHLYFFMCHAYHKICLISGVLQVSLRRVVRQAAYVVVFLLQNREDWSPFGLARDRFCPKQGRLVTFWSDERQVLSKTKKEDR